jgi:hypothetical protein
MSSYLLFLFWFYLWFCRCRLLFLGREVKAVDGSLRTGFLALAAHLALLGIDVGEVVFERDCLELLAGLDALAATDAGSLASLVGDGSLVFVVAENDDATAFRTFEANLDDASRASFCASAASRTLLFIYLGQTSLRVHVECVKLTLGNAITATQTTIAAASLAHTSHLLDATTLGSIELRLSRTILASAVTTYDSHFRCSSLDCQTKDAGHLFHDRLTTYRTELALQTATVGSLYASSGKA